MNLIGIMNNSDEKLINKIVHLMGRDESFDAPQDSIKWTKNLFLSRVTEPKKSLAQKIFAVLQIDLSPNRAIFGERSASALQSRQMLFEAGEIVIDLRVSESAKNFDLRGQILGAEFANTSVKLGEFETKLNELGEFSLRLVPRGVYVLTLQNAEKEIVIENLELK